MYQDAGDTHLPDAKLMHRLASLLDVNLVEIDMVCKFGEPVEDSREVPAGRGPGRQEVDHNGASGIDLFARSQINSWMATYAYTDNVPFP